MTDQTDTPQLVLNNQTRLGPRVLFFCIGGITFVWPAWDLQPWTIPFGLFAVSFWIIVLGAMGLGLAIILLMAFAPNNRLTITPDSILLDRKSIFGASHRNIDVANVSQVTLKRTGWQDGPDSFAVRVTIDGTSNFLTAPVTSEEQAQKLLQNTMNALDAIRSGD